MSRPNEFLVNALRSLNAVDLADVLDRAALALGWVGEDYEDTVRSCNADDSECNGNPCPNGGWCRRFTTIRLLSLGNSRIAAVYPNRPLGHGLGYRWVVYARDRATGDAGSMPTIAEAIEQAEVVAVEVGWRLPWRREST